MDTNEHIKKMHEALVNEIRHFVLHRNSGETIAALETARQIGELTEQVKRIADMQSEAMEMVKEMMKLVMPKIKESIDGTH